jgi:acyl carrier protein
MQLDRVTEIIVKIVNCKREDVRPESKLAELGIDSLKAITLVFELEEAFNVEIPNELIHSIVTVNDVLDRLGAGEH